MIAKMVKYCNRDALVAYWQTFIRTREVCFGVVAQQFQ